jgi:hypothetical protein
MLDRRGFIGLGALVTGAASLVGRGGGARAQAAPLGQLDPVPMLVKDLELEGGFRVVQTGPARYGAIPMIVESGPELGALRFQVDILRRSDAAGAVRGVEEAGELALYVCNGGDGGTRTAEVMHLGTRALAFALGERQAQGMAVPPTLLTFEQRAARFSGRDLVVLGSR